MRVLKLKSIPLAARFVRGDSDEGHHGGVVGLLTDNESSSYSGFHGVKEVISRDAIRTNSQ